MAAEGMRSEARRREILETLLRDAERRTPKASAKYGKSLRRAVPRDVFAAWVPSAKRPDPVSLILERDARGMPELARSRQERMGASALAFMRGAAGVMAGDLSSLPTTGIEVQACGDAHVGNFGLFVAPDGRAVFDILEFDETSRGPWEWDVARLVASIEELGRERGFSYKARAKAVRAAASGYREAMRSLAAMGSLGVCYARLDADSLRADLLGTGGRKGRKKPAKRSRASDLVALYDLAQAEGEAVPRDLETARLTAAVLAQYRKTLAPERAAMLRTYEGVDVAHRIASSGAAGVCSVVVTLRGARKDDVLRLQVREATSSALERYVGKASQTSHGQRLVEGQRAMQAVDDALLGWTSLLTRDGRRRDFYVRQVWDTELPDLGSIGERQLGRLAEACGQALAHAHARTGNRYSMAAYLGGSDAFDAAMVEFAGMYADQNERDYDRWVRANR